MKATNSILIALVIVFTVISFTFLILNYDSLNDYSPDLNTDLSRTNSDALTANAITENVTPERVTIKSASEYDYPPFCIVDENGNADGFSVELLKEALNAVDLDVTFYTGPWSEIKDDLMKGRIQVLPLVGRTPEREKLYDFSVPYETLYGAIFIRRDTAGIINLYDLKDKQIIVMKGDNAEEFVNRINLSDNIITTVNYEEAFRMLSAGKYDAIIVQDRIGSRLLKELNITNVFLVSKIPEFRQDFTFAVKKGDSELLAHLNEGLSKIISSGTYDKVYHRWFDDAANDAIDETSSTYIIPIDPKTRADLIIDYDQQLTAASEKYIATSDEYWKNNYDIIGLRLNNLIAQLKMDASKQKNPYLIDLFDRLDESAVQLFRMEFLAHNLVMEGKTDEANAIITGDEYLKYKKIYSDTTTEYLTFLGVDAKTVYTEKINEMVLQTHVHQYAEKINDRFDVLSKIPDPAEFMLMILKNSIYENTGEFNDKFSIIDGAWRTNLSYYNKSFGTRDVAGVMLYSDYELDDYKKKLMLSLSRDLKTYAVSTNKIFINRYATFENGVDSMYPNDWIFETEHDDNFKDDLWYYIADPQHNPEKKSKWTPVYYDSILGHWMVSLITPIYDGDEFIGTTAGDITLEDINNQISLYTYYGRGYSFIFDDNKNILIHPAYSAEIEKRGVMEELFSFKDIKEKGLSDAISAINNDDGFINFNDNGKDYVMIYYKLDSIGWYYGFVIESVYIDRDALLGPAKNDNYSIDSKMENSILIRTTQARSAFYKLENTDIERIKALLDSFMKQEDYKLVFLENNRTKLYEKSLNLFNNNKEKYGITHFYYIYPNSTTFLRMHVPEQYGDPTNRITFQNSKEFNSWGTGFELGKTAFALRVVSPYYNDSDENKDSVIGYVEFAEDMDYFIQELKKQTKSDYGIIVKKEYINQSDWANVRKTKNLRDNYDDMSKYLVIDSTGSELLFNELCFTQERLDSVTDNGNILGQCKIGQKTYVTSGFTLFDANNSAVGAVVLIHDISEFVKEKQDNELKAGVYIETIVYLFIVFLIILGIILYVLDRLKVIRMKKDVSLALMFIALFIIIILFVFNGYTLTTNTVHNAIDSSSEQLNSLADLKQEQLELYLEEQKEKLEFAATHEELTNEELIYMMGLQDDFDEIFVLDDKGIIVQSTHIEHIGIDRSNDPYFINKKTRSYVKPAYLSDVTNIETITISTPYRTGVLVARLNINGFNELISDRNGLDETGEVQLAYRNPNGDGMLFSTRLFDNRTDVIIPKENTALPMTQALLKNEQLFTEIKDNRNVSVIAATRYFAEADIGMVVKIDRAEVLSSANKINNQIWYFTLGIILAVFVVGITFNALLTRSLRKEIQDKTGELQQKSDELQANIIKLKDTKTAILNMMEDLNESNKHLKDLDEAKTNFLNVASHELKTPLTAMSAYLDVLDDNKGEFNEEQKMGLDAIKRNSNQLKMLINNILEISRIESGRFEVNITEVDVKAKVLLAVENLKILAENKNISIKTEIVDNIPKIMTDDMRFDEILNNLISNAIKFTDKGTITITADVDKSGKFITLSIIDTGVGIPEDKINNLFQNFYQVDSSISRKYGGTGLGLALTKKIVEHQGGKIIVESVLGKGTTFIVTLPITQQKPKISESKEPISESKK